MQRSSLVGLAAGSLVPWLRADFLIIGIGLRSAGTVIAVLQAVSWDVAACVVVFGALLVGLTRINIRGLVVGGVSLVSPPIIIYDAAASGRRLAGAVSGRTELRELEFVNDLRLLNGKYLGGFKVHSTEELPKPIFPSRPQLNRADRALSGATA